MCFGSKTTRAANGGFGDVALDLVQRLGCIIAAYAAPPVTVPVASHIQIVGFVSALHKLLVLCFCFTTYSCVGSQLGDLF